MLRIRCVVIHVVFVDRRVRVEARLSNRTLQRLLEVLVRWVSHASGQLSITITTTSKCNLIKAACEVDGKAWSGYKFACPWDEIELASMLLARPIIVSQVPHFVTSATQT